MSLVTRKPFFCIRENKDADQLRGYISFAVTAKLISAFVFVTRIVQSIFSLNTKFQASSHLLWLYSPVCVGPGRKSRRPVFSQRGSYLMALKSKLQLLCNSLTANILMSISRATPWTRLSFDPSKVKIRHCE